MSEDKSEERRKPVRKYNIRIVIVCIVICVLVIAGAGGYVYIKTKEIPLVQEPNVTVGSYGSPGELQAELDRIVEEGKVTISINATPVFSDGTSEGNVLIGNPPENKNRLTVKLIQDETGDTLFQTGYIDPNQQIDEMALDVDLPAGEYPCTAVFNAYRITDNSYIGTVNAEIMVQIQN